jgi:hypothetical protein
MAMSTHSRTMLLSASVAIAVFALPAAGRAQVRLQSIQVTERQQQAEQYDQEAAVLESADWTQLKQASKLRAKAADLRAADDPKGARSLYWAARDRYYSGDDFGARGLMEQAGERAVTIGDVLTAVTAFTEAAYISADLKDHARTAQSANRAKLLANSPMLTDDQRDEFRSRLGVGGAYVNVVAQVPKP